MKHLKPSLWHPGHLQIPGEIQDHQEENQEVHPAPV